MNYREFVPPIVQRKLREWRRARVPVFKSYEEALARSGEGYADINLPEVVFEKTLRFIARSPRKEMDDSYVVNSLLAVSTGAALSPSRPLRVLDFGGALGTAYFLIREILPVTCKWAVVESPSFVAVGARLETENLGFFSSIEEAAAWLGGVDLLHSSSTIQYVSAPEETISALLATRPNCVAWLRTTFSTANRFVELQSSQLKGHGPGELPQNVADRKIYVPRTYMPLDAFITAMEKDYDLVVRYGENDRYSSLAGTPTILDDRFIYARRPSA